MYLSAHNAALALWQRMHVRAVLAIEWEWYVRDAVTGVPIDGLARKSYLEQFVSLCMQRGLRLHSANTESGEGQVEAALLPTQDVDVLLAHAALMRVCAEDAASVLGCVVDFSAKPFAQDYGSGIHVHVHLEDAAGELLFFKHDDALSPMLQHVLAGLLADAPRHFAVFFPNTDSWLRLTKGFHAPVNLCWGYNNRTAALRIPDGLGLVSGKDALMQTPRSIYRRIEHRLAGADANIEYVLAAVLQGVLRGLEEPHALPEAIYGDASHAQYGLVTLSCELA